VSAELERREFTHRRHRLRVAAQRIVSDCTLLFATLTKPGRQQWQDAVGEALLAGHQARALVERRYHAAAGTVSREEIDALMRELREPQRRVVQAMTRLLALVPTDVDDELLLGDARAIRDAALRLGGDEPGLAPAAPTALQQPAASARFALPGEAPTTAEARVPRILVVDDEGLMRRLLTVQLEELQYEVVAAGEGAAAMAIAEREPIDVIVSDIQMPGCDGFELLKRLKASDVTRDIPVIVVSGMGDVADVVRCIELGADDHIGKPFDALLLQARLRASLERKRLRDQELVYLRRVAQLTLAAEAVESESYEPGSLHGLASHDDALGRLARVFDRVVSGWRAREALLERRVRHLRDEVQESKDRPSLTLLPIPDASALAAGHLLAGRYEIVEELGSGGMGVVYRARDRELNEEVAVKVVRAGLLQLQKELLERLKSEIRLARRITHPNVVRTHDLGEWQGTYFLTMELVQGITVQSLLETQGRLSVASTLAIGMQLAEALVVAHEQQIIHRDIKPANLLVTDAGILKVMDFGLARLVQTGGELTLHGAVVGTPRYMAPERLLGNDVNERSDLFAAGAVLYECLSGLAPYDANSPTAIVARMLEGPPPALEQLVPEVPPALSALVDRLLRYEPTARVPTARELLDQLRKIG